MQGVLPRAGDKPATFGVYAEDGLLAIYLTPFDVRVVLDLAEAFDLSLTDVTPDLGLASMGEWLHCPDGDPPADLPTLLASASSVIRPGGARLGCVQQDLDHGVVFTHDPTLARALVLAFLGWCLGEHVRFTAEVAELDVHRLIEPLAVDEWFQARVDAHARYRTLRLHRVRVDEDGGTRTLDRSQWVQTLPRGAWRTGWGF